MYRVRMLLLNFEDMLVEVTKQVEPVTANNNYWSTYDYHHFIFTYTMYIPGVDSFNFVIQQTVILVLAI